MTHAVIWIDHKEARIFHVHPEATDETTILSPQHHVHRHPKGRGEKLEFFKFVHEHHRPLESKVVGIETADHPTGGEIVARARIYFRASDRMGSPDVRN